MTVESNTSNVSILLENGERVYPCRCGETHRGNYAPEDWHHHNCFHDSPLIAIEKSLGYYICPDCGKGFHLEEEAS